MAVKIRLSRTGRKNLVQYRIVATDSQQKRDGEVLEVLGAYNPEKKIIQGFKNDRFDYWVGVGAQVSDAVKKLQKQAKSTPAAS